MNGAHGMDKKLYILAELDNDVQKKIMEYGKIIMDSGFIGKQTKDIPYHITLSSYSTEKEEYLKNLLENIVIEFDVFDISYSGFGLFNLNVLYLNPCMNMNLLRLYEFTKDESLNRKNDLAAHTTLLIDEPENILKVLPKMVEHNKEISGKIKYISLYEFFPKRLIKRIELRNKIDESKTNCT